MVGATKLCWVRDFVCRIALAWPTTPVLGTRNKGAGRNRRQDLPMHVPASSSDGRSRHCSGGSHVPEKPFRPPHVSPSVRAHTRQHLRVYVCVCLGVCSRHVCVCVCVGFSGDRKSIFSGCVCRVVSCRLCVCCGQNFARGTGKHVCCLGTRIVSRAPRRNVLRDRKRNSFSHSVCMGLKELCQCDL